ncbi:MAG: Wzz/FepE/Etk N-terminal domain-containing protein, partial [Cyclobacteriaceae bacterium]
MDILVLLRVILRRWWIWTTVPLIAGAAAFYFSRQLPDVYKSSAQLSSGLLAEDQLRINDQQKAVNFREVDIKFSNLLQNLKSKNVISLVSYRLIINDLTSANPYRKIDRQNVERPDILNQEFLSEAVGEFRSRLDSMKILSAYDEKEKKLNDLLKIYRYDYDALLENFVISRIGFTDYINIEFFADNPFLCAEAVNILSEEFMRYHNSLRSQFSGESVEFFERMAEEKKREMDEKSRLLSMFKSSNSVLNFEAESQSKVLQIEQLENIRSDEHRRISSINLSLANVNQRLESLNSGSGSESGGTPRLSDYANKIAEMNQRYISTGQSNTQLADSLVLLRREYTLERARVSGMTAGAGSKREQIQKLEEEKNKLEVDLQIAQSAILDLDARIG